MGFNGTESSDTDQFCSQTDPAKPQSEDNNKEYKYPCIKCGVAFKRKDTYDRHIFQHDGVRQFQCQHPGCFKEYTNSSHLKRHARSHLVKDTERVKTIPCTFEGCKSMFMTRDTMSRHLQTHANEKPYLCDQCDQRFRRKLQLKQHLFQHTGEFPHKCPHCDKGFTNQRAFRNHQTSHVVKLHRCSSCAKDFAKWSDLVSHRKIEHIVDYQCRVCLKTFYSKKNLQMHVSIHRPKDEQQVVTCPHERCHKFFFHEKNLRAHIRSKHEGKRKFQCAVCDRQLSTKQKLLHHLKLHISSLNSVKLPRSRRGSTAVKTRCDAGVPKVSSASRLAGVVLSNEADKLLVTGGGEVVVEVADN